MPKPTGPTAPSQFRLAPETLDALDSIVAAYEAEPGRWETRSSVVRQLIHKEAARLAAKKSREKS